MFCPNFVCYRWIPSKLLNIGWSLVHSGRNDHVLVVEHNYGRQGVQQSAVHLVQVGLGQTFRLPKVKETQDDRMVDLKFDEIRMFTQPMSQQICVFSTALNLTHSPREVLTTFWTKLTGLYSRNMGKNAPPFLYFNLLCGMTISTVLQQENMLFRQNVCSFTPINGFEEIQWFWYAVMLCYIREP